MKVTLAALPRLYSGQPLDAFAEGVVAVEAATDWVLERKGSADGAADVLTDPDPLSLINI